MSLLAQLIDDVVVNRIDLNKSMTIGRHKDNDIHVDEAAVSSHHARIVIEKNPYLENHYDVFVEDLDSTNGTFVNDMLVKNRMRLNNNDVIRIAWNSFKYIDDAENALEKTAHILQ
jgi:pSer/pThr/pTyr-binding forkhead associated (FHA) protein